MWTKVCIHTGMVLIDLQKAFDTVDYTILTTKLNATGIDDSAGSWFKSYLAGRKQLIIVVKINGRLSTAGNITCGLGPLLFQFNSNSIQNSLFSTQHIVHIYNNVFLYIRRVEKGTSRRQRLCGLVP